MAEGPEPWRERLASPELRSRLAELIESDAEVRLLRLLLGEVRIYEWALSIGVLTRPELGALVPAVPPPALRSITANESAEEFLWTGLADAHTVLELVDAHGGLAGGGDGRPRLLDFGCGCGRVLRFMLGHADLYELHGTDVNPDHVRWCSENLGFVRLHGNGPVPPLGFETGALDAIWSLSVFTHLDEPAGDVWRAELARVLPPGGLLILTVHGEVALSRIEREPSLATRFSFDEDRRRSMRRSVDDRGFAFVPYHAQQLDSAKAGDSYGMHFTRESHVAARWAHPAFELVTYLPGALRGWQDIVVLRRRVE